MKMAQMGHGWAATGLSNARPETVLRDQQVNAQSSDFLIKRTMTLRLGHVRRTTTAVKDARIAAAPAVPASEKRIPPR